MLRSSAAERSPHKARAGGSTPPAATGPHDPGWHGSEIVTLEAPGSNPGWGAIHRRDVASTRSPKPRTRVRFLPAVPDMSRKPNGSGARLQPGRDAVRSRGGTSIDGGRGELVNTARRDRVRTGSIPVAHPSSAGEAQRLCSGFVNRRLRVRLLAAGTIRGPELRISGPSLQDGRPPFRLRTGPPIAKGGAVAAPQDGTGSMARTAGSDPADRGSSPWSRAISAPSTIGRSPGPHPGKAGFDSRRSRQRRARIPTGRGTGLRGPAVCVRIAPRAPMPRRDPIGRGARLRTEMLSVRIAPPGPSTEGAAGRPATGPENRVGRGER
jgi:hypothetical protein